MTSEQEKKLVRACKSLLGTIFVVEENDGIKGMFEGVVDVAMEYLSRVLEDVVQETLTTKDILETAKAVQLEYVEELQANLTPEQRKLMKEAEELAQRLAAVMKEVHNKKEDNPQDDEISDFTIQDFLNKFNDDMVN